MQEWIGKILSKVEITKHIARGGMADVYLGRHTTLNRNVAVKVLHAHLADNERLTHRFQTEAQAVAALRHPNIVQVFDCDLSEDQPYIIMELLEGMTLADYLTALHKTGLTLPLPMIARLLSALASALDYAHSQGIVHRDIKPSNILLREGNTPIRPGMPLPPDTEPILTDFGVAYFSHATTRTASGTILGTPSYMSPEQIRGEAVDARTDIYSLGIMLYEMLSGKLPFSPEKDTPAAILYKQVHEPPPPLVHDHEVIRQVVNRALEKLPADRYQSTGDFAREFQEAVRLVTLGLSQPQGQATRVSPSSEHKPYASEGKRVLTRRSLLISIAGIFSLIILGAGVFVGNQFIRSLTQRPSSGFPTRGAGVSPTSTASARLETTEASQPTTVSPPVDVTTPVGRVRFDGILIVVELTDTPAPDEGEGYFGFVLDSDDNPFFLGRLEQTEGVWMLSFANFEGGLIAPFHRLVITSQELSDNPVFEPAASLFEAEIPDRSLRAILQLEDIAPEFPFTDAVRSGIQSQSGHHDSHLMLTVQSIRDGNFDSGKLHAEHVINIIEGAEGELFGDWDDNERVDNPGDDFGLLPYTVILQEMLTASQQWAANQDELDLINQLLLRTEELETSILASRKLAQQIALADSIALINELGLAEELSSYMLNDPITELVAELEALDLSLSSEIFKVSP